MFSHVEREDHLSRYLNHGVALYASWARPAVVHRSKENVNGVAPRGAVTHVTAVSDNACTEVHGTPLTTTEEVPMRPVPVMLSGVPPKADPWLGLTEVTKGVDAKEYLAQTHHKVPKG